MTVGTFDKRIALLQSLLRKEHIESAKQFAVQFAEIGDFEHWVTDHTDEIIELSAAPLEVLQRVENGEKAMLLLHAIYFLSVGRRFQTLFHRPDLKSSGGDQLTAMQNLSRVAFYLRTSPVPFYPFENTNLPMIDGFHHASENWW